MSEFLDLGNIRRRGLRDSARHDARVKRAIKENLRSIISDASIFTTDGKRTVKIPIKFLDSYRFKKADSAQREGVGHSNDDGQPGDAIAHDGTGRPGPAQGHQPGDQAGEDVYEEEVEIAEIIEMMLEDFDLPWLERKDNEVEIETTEIIYDDISKTGPMSNVHKKRTIFENMKRNAARGKAEIKGVSRDDLRYRTWNETTESSSNATVYCLMDRSGSMDDNKKYIAKSFFWYLVHFCRHKYTNVELVFIAHTTTAHIVPENDFFSISNLGGTRCSSAFELALENIKEHHPPEKYCNYVFEFSDGDNQSQDNTKCTELVNELLDVCSAVGYGEIDADSMYYGGGFAGWSTLNDEFKKSIDHPKFMSTVLSQKEDVYDCLKKFLSIDPGKDA